MVWNLFGASLQAHIKTRFKSIKFISRVELMKCSKEDHVDMKMLTGRVLVVMMIFHFMAGISPTSALSAQSGNMYVLEAEDWHESLPTQTHQWEKVSTPDNFSGDGAMRALPDSGARINTGYESTSPSLKFETTFDQSGVYYIWVRGFCSGNDNSLHMGLNGQGVASARNITLSVKNNWVWTNLSNGQPAYLEVNEAGIQVIDVWMREDGLILDKIVLTTDPDYVPNGLGPDGDNTSLEPPEILSPEEGVVMDNGCPEDGNSADPILWDFTWSSVDSAQQYEIAILHNGAELINHVGTTTEYNYVCYQDSDEIPLCQIDSSEGEWSFRVRAGNDDYWSDWSEERAFTVEDVEYNCMVGEPFSIHGTEANPASPATLAPGTQVTVIFLYYAPYQTDVNVTLIPYFQGSPLPEGSYTATENEKYSNGYPSGTDKAYFTVTDDDIRVDEVRIEMTGYSSDFYQVEYYFTSDGTAECQAPVLDPIGDIWVEFGDDNNFVISASDPDTDDSELTFETVRVSAYEPPINDNCYFDVENRTFYCLMTDGDYWGNHQQKFIVCDNCSPTPLCDEETVTVTEFVGKNYLTSHTYGNVDVFTNNGPTEIEMSDEGDNRIGIHVKSRCDDTICDYGVSDWGTAYMDYNGPEPMSAYFQFDWGRVQLTIDPTAATADTIVVEEHRDYADSDEDSDNTYGFIN